MKMSPRHTHRPILPEAALVALGLSLVILLLQTGCHSLPARSKTPTPSPLSTSAIAVPVADISVPAPVITSPAASTLTSVTVYKPPLATEQWIAPPQTPALQPNATVIEGAAAFRPIVPDHLLPTASPISLQTVPLPSAALENSQATVDALNRRITELEKALAESEEKSQPMPAIPDVAQNAAQPAESTVESAPGDKNGPNMLPPPLPAAIPTATPAVIPNVVPDPVTEVEPFAVEKPTVSDPATSKPLPVLPQKTLPRKTPVLSIPGVTVSTKDHEIRFRVTDKALFLPGTCRVSPEAESTLRRIVAEIRAIDPNVSLEIEGHTDNLNVDPANPMQKHDISSLKAVVVMEYFVKSLLWSPERVRTSAHGASVPLGDNGTPEGRQQNNRIDIVVLP